MDPFEPTRLRLRISDVDRQIDELFSSFVHWPRKSAIGAAEWQPAIDAYENDDAYLFVADLPGVKAEDLRVRVDADGIAICGTRSSAERVQSGRRLSVERRYGEFCRRFPLAQPVDANTIHVTHEQGVFYIRVPKQKRA